MKLQNLTVIFIIIILPITLILSLYISNGLRTIEYQSLYDDGLLNATRDALYAFEVNTGNNRYSDNADTKRNILKSSVKAFEKSLANTCGISSYNTDEIEEYIPALVFGMYDGFYMYAPSYNSETGKYEHNLKNYVYYSELLDDGTSIIYSLDNYVIVSGDFGDGYQIKEGYLIDLEKVKIENRDSEKEKITYDDAIIDMSNEDAVNYYKEAVVFTTWFLDTADLDSKADYLKIGEMVKEYKNDPEDENSAFVQHKKTVIKEKMGGVLNSSITAYSERTWNQNYKMPKLSDEDWEKIYSNISMISFFQGKQIGFTKYNGYCVLNCTNSNEYVNPNLMYFTDEDNTYHDIRCEKCIERLEEGDALTGYKIGEFSKKKDETTGEYKYNRSQFACYNCINGQLENKDSVYEYVYDIKTNPKVRASYFTSLAKERWNTIKLLQQTQIKKDTITIAEAIDNSMLTKTSNSTTYDIYENKIVVPAGFKILVDSTTGYNENDISVTKGIVIQDGSGNEFVWIPVGNIKTSKTDTTGTNITLGRYNFNIFHSMGVPFEYSGSYTEDTKDNHNSSYGNAIAKDIEAFKTSATTNCGYYLGRFEAGVTGYDANNITTSNSNSETNWTGYKAAEGEELKLVSKSGQQVWNYVTQNKASELSRNMYKDAEAFTSDLINSYAWDTAIVFIQTFGTETDASTYSIKNKSTGFRNTGLNPDKYCNIYDMSGNATEWSTETGSNASFPCIFRGGLYNKFGKVYDASDYHINSASDSQSSTSFRPILYW